MPTAKTTKTAKKKKTAPEKTRKVGRPPATATRERILDAAVKLFAERGYYGVTVREITAEAGVDTALAHHHFGSKQGVFDQALMRRAIVHMEERDKALAKCIATAKGKPTLTDVVVAYVKPYYDRSRGRDKGWKTYFKLLAKTNISPEWSPEIFKNDFDPFVRRFIDAMRLAAPGAPEERYYWCYNFFAGALVLTFAETGRLDRLSGGVALSSDLETAFPLFIPFVVAGMETILRDGKRLSL